MFPRASLSRPYQILTLLEATYPLAASRPSQALKIDHNQSSPTFRQSPAPVDKLREWAQAQNLPDVVHGQPARPGSVHVRQVKYPLALQHVFEEGDALWLPSGWLHMIETGPREEGGGWWASLNLFH